jgi:membrane-associated HD superfamily phosphohydrolase
VIRNFYQLALQREDSVNMDDYRYPGPKPFTREQGILMLADSVEATVRSKAQHGKLLHTRADDHAKAQARAAGRMTLEEMVGSIIDERLQSGQLDNTPLTLQDIALIKQSFVTSLQGIYHPRADYAPQIVKA